jgi:hypothetical protein
MIDMDNFQTIIIGGGAAGMFAATALSTKSPVLLLERGERLGRKLSATGNGQGNVTNLHMGAEHYFSSSPHARARLSDILSRYDEQSLIAYLEDLGGMCLPDERGRVYPASRQASALTDLLRYAIAYRGVTVQTGKRVTQANKAGDVFVVRTETGEQFTAENLLLCAGGKAAKNFGTDGGGYLLAQSFGHTITPLYPSLVQLKTDVTPIRGLKGIRADVLAQAFLGNTKLAEARGDVIFTDYGVSGDAIFRLSAFLADKISLSGGGEKSLSLTLSFLPDISEETLARLLVKKEKNPALPSGEIFCGVLNNQIGRALLKRTGGSAKELAHAAKHFTLDVKGSLGFDYAQVTKGGVQLDETDENLQSKLQSGLYLAGEILDVDGECGGYNLQWAYSSAMVAANAINHRQTGKI